MTACLTLVGPFGLELFATHPSASNASSGCPESLSPEQKQQIGQLELQLVESKVHERDAVRSYEEAVVSFRNEIQSARDQVSPFVQISGKAGTCIMCCMPWLL